MPSLPHRSRKQSYGSMKLSKIIESPFLLAKLFVTMARGRIKPLPTPLVYAYSLLLYGA